MTSCDDRAADAEPPDDAVCGPAADVDVVHVNEANGRNDVWRVELVHDEPWQSHVIVSDSHRSASESDEVQLERSFGLYDGLS